jgi:hypothetical protein
MVYLDAGRLSMHLAFQPALLCISVEENILNELELSLYVLSGSQSISESLHAFDDSSSLSLLPVLDDHVS